MPPGLFVFGDAKLRTEGRRMKQVLMAVSMITWLGTAHAVELLNVSYDLTRELWRQLNERFIAAYAKSPGRKLTIKQTHDGSSPIARSAIHVHDPDAVTVSLAPHTDRLRKP